MNLNNRRSTATYAALTACFLLAMAWQSPSICSGEEPLRALVVTGGHEFDEEFFGLFEGHDDIVYTKVAHPDAFAELTPERIARHDVVVLYDMYQGKPTPEAARESFLSFLKQGKGLVVLHHALAGYRDWPEFAKIIGGEYLMKPREGENGVTLPASTYRHDTRFRVEIADPSHPIVEGLEDFDLLDEVYGSFVVQKDVHQLLRTDHPESGAVIGWCKEYLQSRVVFLQPGHGPSAYRNPSYRRLVARSIRWTARRLAEPPPETEAPEPRWQRLFNGVDLAGWTTVGKGRWDVRDGVLVGTQAPGAVGGELLSEKEFSDFDLRVTYRIAWPANSGVWFRYQSANQAYQADILEWQNPRCWSGSIYCPGKMFIALNTDPDVVRKDGWNTMRIRARGKRLTVDLNGRRVGEAVDDSSSRGRVGFQVHSGEGFEKMQLEVLDVRVAPLDADS